MNCSWGRGCVMWMCYQTDLLSLNWFSATELLEVLDSVPWLAAYSVFQRIAHTHSHFPTRVPFTWKQWNVKQICFLTYWTFFFFLMSCSQCQNSRGAIKDSFFSVHSATCIPHPSQKWMFQQDSVPCHTSRTRTRTSTFETEDAFSEIVRKL